MPTASIAKGRGYLNHNDRTIKQVNSRSWKPELSSQNIVYVNEPIQNVYHELFDPALEKYNAKIKQSKNPQRVIKDYYEHISRSKQEKPFYEFIVAFGNVNDKNTEIYPVLQQCLDEYNRDFQSRNPNFYVFQQITHRDEVGIDHTHMDIVPVCSGNTRGLETKNSFSGALKQMGFTGKNAFLDWRRSEEKVMAEILERHGLEFERGDGRQEHLNVRQYQEYKHYEEQTIQELKNLENLKQISTNVHQNIDQLNASKQTLLNEINSLEVRKNRLQKETNYNAMLAENQNLKEQINTLNDLQIENKNLKLDLKKEKQRSENFKIIGKLYQCMYLHLMDHIIPSVIQNFKIVKLIRNGLDNLFIGVLDEYQNKSKNPDIYTQLFQDNTTLNNSYPNIDQEFANLPDVDELIEQSELDQENEYYR
jgi:hypothetical protein